MSDTRAKPGVNYTAGVALGVDVVAILIFILLRQQTLAIEVGLAGAVMGGIALGLSRKHGNRVEAAVALGCGFIPILLFVLVKVGVLAWS